MPIIFACSCCAPSRRRSEVSWKSSRGLRVNTGPLKAASSLSGAVYPKLAVALQHANSKLPLVQRRDRVLQGRRSREAPHHGLVPEHAQADHEGEHVITVCLACDAGASLLLQVASVRAPYQVLEGFLMKCSLLPLCFLLYFRDVDALCQVHVVLRRPYHGCPALLLLQSCIQRGRHHQRPNPELCESRPHGPHLHHLSLMSIVRLLMFDP